MLNAHVAIPYVKFRRLFSRNFLRIRFPINLWSEISSYSSWFMSFHNFFTQLPRRIWETTWQARDRQKINMQECESHASVHSCELLVEVFEIPMKRNVVNLFSTLILNKDDRYCREKSSHQVCLYIYCAVNISLLVQFTAFYSNTNLSVLIFSAT